MLRRRTKRACCLLFVTPLAVALLIFMQEDHNPSSDVENPPLMVDDIFRPFERSLSSRGHLTYTRLNKMLTDFEEDDVSLSTQCSLGHLSYLPTLARHWRGPISVAVFVETRRDILTILKPFIECNAQLLSTTEFHIAYLSSSQDVPEEDAFIDLSTNGNCSGFTAEFTRYAASKRNWLSSIVYPGNVLRNIAMDGCNTDYIFPVDVDFLPSKDLRKMFNSFQRAHRPQYHSQTAYIVPSFEVKTDNFNEIGADSTSIDKSQLLSLIKSNQAQQYHLISSRISQGSTDYKKWEQLPQVARRKLQPAYTLPYTRAWEPYFIARRDCIPYYDERILGWGFDRRLQLCAVHMYGNTFKVLDNAFILHDGIKDYAKEHSDENIHNQVLKNQQVYEQAIKELADQHSAADIRACTQDTERT